MKWISGERVGGARVEEIYIYITYTHSYSHIHTHTHQSGVVQRQEQQPPGLAHAPGRALDVGVHGAVQQDGVGLW